MRKYVLLSALLTLLFISCNNDDNGNSTNQTIQSNEILYLQVKYTTNEFMGGYVIPSTHSMDLEVYKEYILPADLGNLKIFEEETDILLFDGDMVWAGLGERHFPSTLLSPNYFQILLTNDYVEAQDYDQIFNFSPLWPVPTAYEGPWVSIQNLVLVRQKISENPQLTVSYFLYMPSVGIGDPEDWYWVFLIK